MKRLTLSVQHLSAGYKEKIVIQDLNFDIREGECICLLGANGSGKSTLLRTLSKLQPQLGGKILINGKLLSSLNHKELSQSLSVVLTDKPLIDNFKVYDVVALGRFPYTNWLGKLSVDDIGIIENSLSAAGIDHLREQDFSEISDGEKQKVMIARALAQETPLIILDEPTTHLDLPSRMEIAGLLRTLSDKQNKTILFSSHELDLALYAATKCLLLGKVVEFGIPEDLILKGYISAAFDKKEVRFDIQKGHFIKKDIPKGFYQIKGDETLVKWTRSALEREGYEEKSMAELYIECTPECWSGTFNKEEQRFTSLEDLLAYIRTK